MGEGPRSWVCAALLQAVAAEESSVACATYPPAPESLPVPSHQEDEAPSPLPFRDTVAQRLDHS